MTRQRRPVVLGALLLGTVLTVGVAGAVADTISGTGEPGESQHVVTGQFHPDHGPGDFPLNAVPGAPGGGDFPLNAAPDPPGGDPGDGDGGGGGDPG